MATGRCMCGELRYEYQGEPLQRAICHCLTCRRLTGSAYTTNLIVAENQFKVTAGTPKTYSTKQDSGMTLTYSFCGNCGCTTHKVVEGEAFKGVIIVQAGSLDDTSGFDAAEPEAELWTSRRVPWLSSMEGKGQMKEFA